MIRKIMSDVDVKLGIKSILSRIDEAVKKRPETKIKPLLVAVSKIKPVELILEAYNYGQRDFGENYVQELIDKASDPIILENCKDIKWHFIGHLQTNKINKIINIPGLYMIQTIDSKKIATTLNNACQKLMIPNKDPLKILIQVNTSGEEEKNGIKPSDVCDLYEHIVKSCNDLKLEGIMTIGKFGHDYSTGPNQDFVTLMECHEKICKKFKLQSENVQVSMGMSDDFEYAIEMGSTIVRVGSSIFGYRPKKNES